MGLGTEKKRDERAGEEERDGIERKCVLDSREREGKLQVADRRTGHRRIEEFEFEVAGTRKEGR